MVPKWFFRMFPPVFLGIAMLLAVLGGVGGPRGIAMAHHLPPPTPTPPPEERALEADRLMSTVMIKIEHFWGATDYGTGVVVQQGRNEFSILTSCGVLEGYGDGGSSVSTRSIVFFNGNKARITRYACDSSSDLAIFQVPRIRHGVAIARMLDVSSSDLAGMTPLEALGNPDGKRYVYSRVVPTPIDDGHLAAYCDSCSLGDSGAGIWDASGHLVGLITDSSSLPSHYDIYGVASISAVFDIIRRYGVR